MEGPPSKRQRTAKSHAQLQVQRACNDLRLKSKFEHIFEKFSKDFSGVGDEIDLSTGKVVVNNGHLITMQNERDIEGLANDEDELTAEPVGSSKESEFNKSNVPADLQDDLLRVRKAVVGLALPTEVPCVGLNIASAITMDDGAAYDNSVHGELFINRTILDQLSRLGPHIRKSIANVKRSAATSVVVSIETEDLSVDPKWRVPVLLQPKADEEVNKALEASETVEAPPKLSDYDLERSLSPEGVSLWALDTLPSLRKGLRQRDVAAKAPRLKDSIPTDRMANDRKLNDPMPKDPKSKDPSPTLPRPEDPKIKDTKSKHPTPKNAKLLYPGPRDKQRDEFGHKEASSRSEVHYGLTSKQVRVPGRTLHAFAQRRDYMRLTGLNGTPLPESNANTDNSTGKDSAKDSEAAASSPPVQKQEKGKDSSKNTHSPNANDQTNKTLAEDTYIAPRNRKRGLYKKTKERLGEADTHLAQPDEQQLEAPGVTVDGDTGPILDNLVRDGAIAPRNRNRGLYKKTREQLCMPDTHAVEQVEPTGSAPDGDSSLLADSQELSSSGPSQLIAYMSPTLKGRKRGRPSLVRGPQDACESPTPQKNDRPGFDQPRPEEDLPVETLFRQDAEVAQRRGRKSKAKLVGPQTPKIFSVTPEMVRDSSPDPVACEKETKPAANRSSPPKMESNPQKTRLQAPSGLPPLGHDAKNRLAQKPGKSQGSFSPPSPLNTNVASQKSLISGTVPPKTLIPHSLASPSTPDDIISSIEPKSSVRARLPVLGGSAPRRRTMWSISSSPDPVADGSENTKNVNKSTLSNRSQGRATPKQHLRPPIPKKRQGKSASSAPRVSISSMLGDGSDDELSNINTQCQTSLPTRSPGSSAKSRPCGSPGYNCERSLCLSCT